MGRNKKVLLPGEATKLGEKIEKAHRQALLLLAGEGTSGRAVESPIEELRPGTSAATMAPPQEPYFSTDPLQRAQKKQEVEPDVRSSPTARIASQMEKKQSQELASARLQAETLQRAGKKPEFEPEILSSLAVRVASQMVKKQSQEAAFARLQTDVKNLLDEREQLKTVIAGWEELHKMDLASQQKNTARIAQLLEENKKLTLENAQLRFYIARVQSREDKRAFSHVVEQVQKEIGRLKRASNV